MGIEQKKSNKKLKCKKGFALLRGKCIKLLVKQKCVPKTKTACINDKISKLKKIASQIEILNKDIKDIKHLKKTVNNKIELVKKVQKKTVLKNNKTTILESLKKCKDLICPNIIPKILIKKCLPKSKK